MVHTTVLLAWQMNRAIVDLDQYHRRVAIVNQMVLIRVAKQ